MFQTKKKLVNPLILLSIFITVLAFGCAGETEIVEKIVEVEKNCHISTGTILNGGAKIGKNTFIGSGAILKEGIKVGENSIITAGSIVLKDVKNNNIYKNEK